MEPPKIYMENRANKVVTEVIRVLDKVSFVEVLEISDIDILEYFNVKLAIHFIFNDNLASVHIS